MPHVLDELAREKRGWGSKANVEWAYVTIELPDVPDGPSRFTGAVLIDGRRLGYLIDARPRKFRLAPGDHRIAVHLGRESRVVGYPGPDVASGRFTLTPGERIGLACRADGPAAEEWRRFARLNGRYGRILLGCIALAGCVGWALGPSLQRPVAEALAGLDLDRDPARFRDMFGILTAGTCEVAGLMLISISRRRTTRRLRDRIGDPYRIEKRELGGCVNM